MTGNIVLQYGGVAQLGEHLPCKQGVDSSILFVSTTARRRAKSRCGLNEREDGNREAERSEAEEGLAGWQTNGHGYGLIAQVVRAHA